MPISSKSSRVSSPNIKIQDVPELPTITGVLEDPTSATALNISVTASQFGGRPEVYRATSTPGNIQGVSSGSSPITVNGLTPGTNYNFTVRAETSAGASRGPTALSTASNTPTGALVPIATTTISGSAAPNITFNNIPQTFKDLRLVYHVRSARNDQFDFPRFTINDDGSAIYSFNRVWGDGGGGTGNAERNNGNTSMNFDYCPAATATANTFATATVDLFSYRRTDKFKSALGRVSSEINGSGGTFMYAQTYASLNPITKIVFFAALGNLAIGTTATLYGIKAAS